MTVKMTEQPRNMLLKAFGIRELEVLLNHAEVIHYDYKEVIASAGSKLESVDFPETAIAALVQRTSNGASTEVMTIGNEGMLGAQLLLGHNDGSQTVICRVEGSAIRVEKDQFLRLADAFSSIKKVCGNYAGTMFNQLAQNILCNQDHDSLARCASWFLRCSDRCGRDEIFTTQDSLGDSLNCSRQKINEAASALQKKNLISYSRGRVRIINRIGLEETACSCYRQSVTAVAQVQAGVPVLLH